MKKAPYGDKPTPKVKPVKMVKMAKGGKVVRGSGCATKGNTTMGLIE